MASSRESGPPASAVDRQRIDKWLWHARVVRTRSAAAALAVSGQVRVNGGRIDAASKTVRAGDVVTVALDRGVRVLKVKGFADRRGSADAAQSLYEDLGPSRANSDPPSAVRDPGSGRPTKQNRRALDRLRSFGDS
jgi:ribosome-associated heat shock protein Hsp15